MSIEKTRLDATGWSRQEAGIGLSYAEPAQFTADGAGAANGTTTVCAGLIPWGATADVFVGLILHVVHCDNGPAGEYGGGFRARITEYDPVTGTLTHEALPWQTDSGDTFHLLHPPHGWWSDDTGGAAVTIQDADRDEVANYWVGSAEQGGPYAVCIEATNVARGTQRLTSAFVQATGDLTVANLGANTVVGDLFDVLQYPEVTGGPVAFEQPRLDREPMAGSMGRLRGVAAPVTVSGQQELLLAGPGEDRVGSECVAGTVLGASLLVDAASAGCTVDAAATVNSIPLSAGAGVEGRFYLTAEGDAFFAAVGGDPITPDPALRTAPADGSALVGLRRYTPPDTLDPSWAVFVRQWYGRGLVEDLWGCRAALTLALERGTFPRLGMAWQGVTGYRRHLDQNYVQHARSAHPILPTVTPRAIDHVRVVIDGIELSARTVNVDLGLDLQPRINEAAPDLVEAIDIRAGEAQATIDLYLDEFALAMLERYREGRACRLFVQAGRVGGDPGVTCLWIHEAEIISAPIGDDAGARTAQIQLVTRHDPTRDADWPRWALARG